MRVGLVLGGGGVVGLAAHAGALTALENDLGWDPRAADILVGTSAGAITAALLRRGVPPSDLAAMTVGATTRATPSAISQAVTAAHNIPEFTWRALARFPHFPSRTIVGNWVRRPWRLDPLSALVSIVGNGQVDLATLAHDHADALGSEWPEEDLWICAVRQRDLKRFEFGRGEMRPALSDAVMASCSIPGFFSPVAIDGGMFLDGGVRSPTNADVLAKSPLDLVIVLSPMSGRDLPIAGVGPALRRYAKRKLEGEIGALHHAGIPTVVIEPGPELCEIMGTNPMCEDNVTDIVGHAFLDAGEQIRKPFVRTLLAGLDKREHPRQRRAG
jgi:NTE family protein